MSLVPVTVDRQTLPALLLADAKAHLRVDADFEDEYIADLIARVIGEWEAMGDGVKIHPGQWAWSPAEADFDAASGSARIPVTPINTIAVTAGATTVSTDYALATDYSSGAIRWRLVGAWQSDMLVTIDTGYADAALIPAELRGHIFEGVARHYEYRNVVDGSGLVMLPGWRDFLFAPFWNPKA